MADLLDRLVARSRVPAPSPRARGRSSFAVEEEVVLAPSRAATPRTSAPTAVAPTLSAPPAPAAPPPRIVPEPAPEASTVVRVEVAAPRPAEDSARPLVAPGGEPRTADPRTTAPGPLAPPAPREQVVPAPPRTDPEQPAGAGRRVVERVVEARTDVRSTQVLESVTDRVTVLAPQVARPRSAVLPPLPAASVGAVPEAPVPPSVHIHIGRLDVRGADGPAPAAPPAPAPAGPAASVLSLGDFLRGRAQTPS